jgi:alkylhydroperoxidase family enzyme
MRLGYVGASNAHPHSAAWWAKNGQDPDRALHLVRTWAWSPWLQECQQRLGHALHEQTAVAGRTKELAINRVCGRHASEYELYHHAPLASASGVDDDVLKLVTSPELGSLDGLDRADRFVVKLADCLDATGRLGPDLEAEWRDHLTPDQLVALVLQIGYWGCNARFANAMQLQNEPWLAPVPGRRLDPGPKRPPFSPEAVDPVGAFGLPAMTSLSDRQRDWLGRWPEADDRLARLWSWVPDVQVANQRMWDCISSDQVEAGASLRRAVALRVSGPGTLLGELVANSPQWSGPDLDSAGAAVLDAFVTEWLAGGRVGDDTFDAAHGQFGRQRLVEIQLMVGWLRTQAALAAVAGLAG